MIIQFRLQIPPRDLWDLSWSLQSDLLLAKFVLSDFISLCYLEQKKGGSNRTIDTGRKMYLWNTVCVFDVDYYQHETNVWFSFWEEGEKFMLQLMQLKDHLAKPASNGMKLEMFLWDNKWI